ncbi:hypothetical protein R1sor_016998 [Riccia sorocarpa]|uniref:J domain-containing protein n=1 Tax=Riccia sorocarpa TaxID=122646 RepID=A0ABD3I630_9MARC
MSSPSLFPRQVLAVCNSGPSSGTEANSPAWRTRCSTFRQRLGNSRDLGSGISLKKSRKFGQTGAAATGEDGRRFKKFETKAYRGKSVGDLEWSSSTASPYEVLGVNEESTEEEIKSAFRARIKEYHPDVYQGVGDADAITQRLLRAYEILTKELELPPSKRKSLDPFKEPECVAEDLFVNEVACIGRNCPYSCVERAPDVFQFAYDTGCARAVTQGKGGEYHVQLAVGQCPRNCIHYLTPRQRITVEELLRSVIEGTVYSNETIIMEGLIAKANFENNRYQPPKRKAKKTEEWVDWF